VRLRTLDIDAWSWLNDKPVMADPDRPANRRAFPELGSWVPAVDVRRLAAYKLLAAYDSNQAEQFAAVAGDHHGLERRELGDASKLIDTTLGYLLGAEQTIVVSEADQADQVEPPAGAARAAEVQEQLPAWTDKELLPLRIQQAERAPCGPATGCTPWRGNRPSSGCCCAPATPGSTSRVGRGRAGLGRVPVAGALRVGAGCRPGHRRPAAHLPVGARPPVRHHLLPDGRRMTSAQPTTCIRCPKAKPPNP
jgi:hypothetical protein